jgi:hypothetical protein
VLTLSGVEFIASPVDGKDDVRLRGKKVGLKGHTGAKEGGISAPQTPDRPDPREAQGVCTGALKTPF